MIELTVKTLNAANHKFSVPNDYTVQQLKEHIAETIQIPCESQRCIYLGQVLPDDAKLSDRNVHGKVIHVVQGPPPSTVLPNESQTSENGTSNDGNSADAMPDRRFETHTGTMYLGAMAFPSGLMDAGGLAFLHPRTNLSVSRLVVARNLLRRAINIINQLENENYFGTNEEQSGQSQSHSESGNLSEDINSTGNGNGLEQSDVEIRIELPNSHLDSGAESIVPPEAGAQIPDHNPTSDTPTTESVTVGELTSENTSSSQAGSEDVTEGNQRDDTTRRRSSRTPMMATVMGAVLHAQVRLIPFMRLLRQYLLQDTTFEPNADTTHTEQQVQSLYNSVSELMHYFSHIYHSLSDIMCDFSQPPPRTLRCRPVILEQQHATVLRGPRRSTIIRSPVVAISRSTSTTAESESAATATADPPEVGMHDADIDTSSAEVVIEEADTTNMQDNHDEGLPERMDTSEPIVTPPEDASGHNNASNLDERTAVGGNDSAYVIQSMPEGIFSEGIRINSVEATILTPSDYVGASLASGPNQRWRAGILPAEVFQNMFGFLSQFRQTPRSQRPGTGERPRQQNSNFTFTPGINQTNQGADNQSRHSSNDNTNSETARQPQSNSNERMFEFDITALSRTFDPFLPCRSHHVHPFVSRASGVRNGNSRASTSQNSTAGQTTQPQPNAQTLAQQLRQDSQDVQSQQSATEDPSEAQQRSHRNDEEEEFGIPEISRNVTNLFSNIFPELSIGNVTVRRGSADAHGTPSESDGNGQARHPARAHIQVTSNLNAMFPDAIQIELDPMMGNLQATTQQSDSYRGRARIATARLRRYQGNVANNGQLQMSSSTSSTSSSSPSSSPTLSILSSDEDDTLRTNKEDKENSNGANPSRTIRHLYSMVEKENIQHLTDKNSETMPEKEVANNYPLYIENQEAVLFDVISAMMNNTSFSDITKNEVDIGQLSFLFRQKIRGFLLERRNLINGDKNSLLNSVNILINNDLYRMKNLLDSDCVKQGIDLVSTICKFNQDSVPELIQSIVKTDDTNNNELRKFYKKFNFFIARLLTLFVYCISGDDKSTHIKKILGAVVEEAIKSLPKDEELVRWLRKDLINHVISYSKVCQSDNLPQFMRQYVVYRLPPVIPVECTVATARITNIGENNMTLIEQPQPMDIEDVQIGSSSSSEVLFASANSVVRNVTNQAANSSAFSSDNRPAVIPVVSGVDTLPEVVLNSEEWHRSIPSDWVPIITRDIHRLRRQGSQPPFSDAYLSGMPSKRRKLVKKGKPNLQENSEFITDNISTAIDAAGLSASMNTIANHVAEVSADDGNLSEIVKEELKENVRENLVQHADFLPQRFPDSSKYFMDK